MVNYAFYLSPFVGAHFRKPAGVFSVVATSPNGRLFLWLIFVGIYSAISASALIKNVIGPRCLACTARVMSASAC